MNIKTLVFNTTSASGADCTVSGKRITISGAAGGENVTFDYDNMLGYTGRKPRVAGTLQVTTGVITNSTTLGYKIYINATNSLTGETRNFGYSLDANAAATAAITCNALVALINADTTISVTASNVANDLVLTADSPYWIFDAVNIGQGTIAFTTGTAGVLGIGSGTLIQNSQFADDNIVTTNNYTTFVFQVQLDTTFARDSVYKEVQTVVVYVNEAATNYESFAGTYGTLTQALSGTVATYSAGTGTLAATAATDLLTLATGEFAAQGIMAGDVLFQDGETTYYLVNTVLSVSTANAIVGADNAAAAYTIIKLRRI